MNDPIRAIGPGDEDRIRAGIPRPEYPRPDRDRSAAWINLNGEWEFLPGDGEFVDLDDLPQGQWHSTINVPFAWETKASGVGRFWLEIAWYRSVVVIPPQWGDGHPFLCFGAVHYSATIWVNSRLIGGHTGGYSPFEFDLHDVASSGDRIEIVVRVQAPIDKRDIPHGKQRSIPRDDYDAVCFTASSGIWQTVWIESRPALHLSRISLRGDSLDSISVALDVNRTEPASVQITVVDGTGREVAVVDGDFADATYTVSIPIAKPRLWEPGSPHLYIVKLTVRSDHGVDEVISYVGLRSVAVDGETLLLNGMQLYVRGVLDQGYWPASGITPPTDESLTVDLKLAADAGYNLVRKHLKFEDPRWLHHADVMGMLVWAEPASTGRYSVSGIQAFEDQIVPMVERDANHPSIIIWGLYNEEWGLDWDVPNDPKKQHAIVRAYDLLRSVDDTRPIVDNSGWAHVKTDLVDWHYYEVSPTVWAQTIWEFFEGTRNAFPVELNPGQLEQKLVFATSEVPRSGIPILNSEYGGGFTSLERGWLLRWQTQELRRHQRNIGYVYTELTDIEHETAGICDANRQVKDLGSFDPAIVNSVTTLIMDIEPVAPGMDVVTEDGTVVVPLRGSHHGSERLVAQVLSGWSPPFSPRDDLREVAEHGVQFEIEPFSVTPPIPIHAQLPAGWSGGRLWFWLETNSSVQAQTFLDITRSDATCL